jgi:hypothetical protein
MIGVLIPVSDSGEAGASIVFEHLRSSLIRGFAPASCAKITFRNQELFGYFLADKKYRTEERNRND